MRGGEKKDRGGGEAGAGVALRLGAGQRLKKGREFQRVYREGIRSSDRWLIVFAQENGLGHSRVGVSVGKRLGPAVRRNRYKRTLREAFRLLQHNLPAGYDYVLVPRAAESSAMETYRRSLHTLGRRLHKRQGREQGRGDR